MCGVVSIIYPGNTENLGSEACELLKKLEYRGYDSTGGAFIKEDQSVILKKKVGAPTVVTKELQMEAESGRKFIGQVRWATFGSVTDENAQPHHVNCLADIVGAHNGNITNTDSLKEFLLENNHHVLSDNDGEMLTHMVEHYYHELSNGEEGSRSVPVIKKAIRKAQEKIQGSYAACISFHGVPGVFAMKAGSSLYAGKGEDESGRFIVVSSDLTSVLSKTRFLIPLAEGEGLYFTDSDYEVFSLTSSNEYIPGLKRSKLNISDISLNPRYRFFMEQEIDSSVFNMRNMMQYYLEEESEKEIYEIYESEIETIRELLVHLLKLNSLFESHELESEFRAITERESFRNLMKKVVNCPGQRMFAEEHSSFESEEASLLSEISAIDRSLIKPLALMDSLVKWKKKRTIISNKKKFLQLLEKAGSEGNRIYIIASGTSQNAGLVAGYFLNCIAGISVIPANPGTFRSLYSNSLREGDILIGISQSGETKDLVNIYNDVLEKYKDGVKLLSVVNNENSTIPQEKSQYYLPILCGPEIAVAATKSFINQIGLFYLLAMSLSDEKDHLKEKMENLCLFMDDALNKIGDPVSEVAKQLFMEPSMHILGTSMLGLAKEGALKIREVVINHTEGFDSAEFKHGPNTILGKNMGFSLLKMEQLQKDTKEKSINLDDYFSNYPLVFLCPPDKRDMHTTIAQIHTHKIRGANIILIAEENEELRKAVEGRPSAIENYFSAYVQLPETGDRFMYVFNAALTLQLLALKMSTAKREYLDELGIEEHGVHPDVPKNVSKSITVD